MKVMREIEQTPIKKEIPLKLFNGMIKSAISIVDKNIEMQKQREEQVSHKNVKNLKTLNINLKDQSKSLA